ncbi:MAG: LuxR C-terminal-related transcriptional regulator [Pirellulales bacterium]
MVDNSMLSGKVLIVSSDLSFAAGVRAITESMKLNSDRLDTVKQDLVEVIRETKPACVVVDYGPTEDDMFLLLNQSNWRLMPAMIFCLREQDLRTAAALFKQGAFAIAEKPLTGELLLGQIKEAISLASQRNQNIGRWDLLHGKFSALTQRQLQILSDLLRGKSNKWIAERIGVSKRTVELDRHEIMTVTMSESSAELARYAVEYCMLSRMFEVCAVLKMDW